MPELPDVEVFRKYYEMKAEGRYLENLRVEDEKVLGDPPLNSPVEEAAGSRMGEASRRGKQMFVRMEDDGWLALHFGMTGFLSFFEGEEPDSDHPRAIFDFEDGTHLAFDCLRRLGEVNFLRDKESFIESKGLGPDALSENLDYGTFREIYSGSRAMIKSGLMVQSKIAGVGNVYSDEILFQSRIHPRRKCRNLSGTELEEVYDQMKFVLNRAIEARAEPEEMPEDFLLSRRETGGDCPNCSGEIERVKVSGRSSYFCPSCQVSEDSLS